MSNDELWNLVFRTNPAFAKDFKKAGGFSGTAIDPMYLHQLATQVFGAKGIGWGSKEIDRVISEQTHYCLVELWYMWKGDKGVVQQWGGTSRFRKNGDEDDECFKKSFTDAEAKCLSSLGFSADVYMGLFDGNKYIDRKKGVWPTAAARKKWFESLISDIKAASDIDELSGIWLDSKTTLDQAEVSLNEEDRLGFGEVKKQATAKKDELQRKQEFEPNA